MHRVRVLVVDGHADHGESLRLLFEARGCVVLLARDCHQALAMVTAHRPDALLVDLDLLGAGAICAAARSGNRLGVLVAGIAGLGVDACNCDVRLVKPYRFEDLAAGLEAFISARSGQKRAANGEMPV